ncbi:hypothetical protein GCM10009868_17360 [Terrabacter aerolatus]|uniref:Uncharacterized protein n=1 Tax=Terrabacter aerolatus TaxID=422442 RepID=A0A512D270_9MICO|nr:hypothetical protein TAE01_23680 [Terrabacter aerolatus]
MSGFVTPTSSAISSIVVAWMPRAEKTCSATASICASRSARGMRVRVPGEREVTAAVYGGTVRARRPSDGPDRLSGDEL